MNKIKINYIIAVACYWPHTTCVRTDTPPYIAAHRHDVVALSYEIVFSLILKSNMDALYCGNERERGRDMGKYWNKMYLCVDNINRSDPFGDTMEVSKTKNIYFSWNFKTWPSSKMIFHNYLYIFFLFQKSVFFSSFLLGLICG